MERFDGAAAWREISPIIQDRIGAIALELVVAHLTTDRSFDAEVGAWLDAAAGRAAEHASVDLGAKLDASVVAALPEKVVGPGVPLAVPSLIGQVCRACGCSEDDACCGGCSWVAPDLCSKCAPKER